MLSFPGPDGCVIHNATEVKQMQHRRIRHEIDGSPETALLLFAMLAVFAYILS